MTAKDIQRALVRDLYRDSFALMNYTPERWWECDVFQITSAGYFREYEIKVSRKDFFADAEKVREVVRHKPSANLNAVGRRTWERVVEQSDKKHDLLANPERALAARFNVPVQFWFVAPEGLIKREELPAWAGLLEAHPPYRSGAAAGILWHSKRDGDRLHDEKLDRKILEHARGVCYWRMHKLFLKDKTNNETGKED